MFLAVFVVVLFTAISCSGFTTTNPSIHHQHRSGSITKHNNNRFSSTSTTTTTTTSTTTALQLLASEIPDAASFARGDCVFWFFGASGAAGIGRTAFPNFYNRWVSCQKLSTSSSSSDGDLMGIPTALCGYPNDILVSDVQKVVNNPLSIEQQVDKFPIADNYLSSKGYLNIQAFEAANAKCDALAVRAVFDTFAQATDQTNPTAAQAKIDRYKADVMLLKQDLLFAKFVSTSAILVLLFLLGLADIIAFSDVYHGWFPDWPGGTNFPFSMFTEPNGSPFKIRDYWI